MEVLSYLAGAILLVILAYVLVRVASYAFFRTRLEYMRSVLRELNGGHKNGKE